MPCLQVRIQNKIQKNTATCDGYLLETYHIRHLIWIALLDHTWTRSKFYLCASVKLDAHTVILSAQACASDFTQWLISLCHRMAMAVTISVLADKNCSTNCNQNPMWRMDLRTRIFCNNSCCGRTLAHHKLSPTQTIHQCGWTLELNRRIHDCNFQATCLLLHVTTCRANSCAASYNVLHNQIRNEWCVTASWSISKSKHEDAD